MFGLLLGLNLVVDFLSVNGDFAGGIEAEADSFMIDLGDDDLDIVADHDGFIEFAGED